MTTFHRLTKRFSRITGLLVVTAIGLFGIVGSGSNGDGNGDGSSNGGPTSPGSLGVFYGVNEPDFLAYRVGLDGAWTKASPSGLRLDLDVGIATDFSLVALCRRGSIRRAYYYESSTTDLSDIRLDCDNTDADTTYTLSGTRSGPGAFAPTAVYIGDYADVTSDTDYTLNFELDADDTGPKDIVASTRVGGLLHYKFRRGVSLQSSINWDFSIEPSDTGDNLSYDVSALRLEPDYLFTGLRLYTANGTRADLDNNSTDDSFIFQKAPSAQRRNSDVYRLNSRLQGTDNWRSYAQWSVNPQGATLDQVPNELGTIDGTAGEAGDDFEWSVSPTLSYDFGIGGITARYMEVWAESTVPSEGDIALEWRLYKTASPLGSGLAFQLDRGVTDLDGWNDDWLVGLEHITKVGFVGSNGTVQETLDTRKAPSSDLDGLDEARSYSIGLNLSF